MSCDIRKYSPSGSDDGEMEMRLTAFIGGKHRGACVQFTIGTAWCQLSEQALLDLIFAVSARLARKDGYTATGNEPEDIIFKEED